MDRRSQAASLGDRTFETLRGLGPMADRLCCVVSQPEMISDSLRSIGFFGIHTASDFSDEANAKDCPVDADAILLPTLDSDRISTMKACSVLSADPTAPVIIVLLLLPQRIDSPHICGDFQNTHTKMREELLHAGADDVITVMLSETIYAHRVVDVIHKAEFLSKHVSQEINNQVEAFKKKASRDLQLAYRKFLADLPGHTLENLPRVDSEMKETQSEDGTVSGVGPIKFHDHLGKGAFGSVFKADHPEFGTCAVKQISKAYLKNASMLFSLDREVCILRFLAQHPNVVKAYRVVQTQQYFYIVMSYAGKLNLHEFVKLTLRCSGTKALSAETVIDLVQQEAQAVAHLHRSRICHRDLKPTNWIVSDAGKCLSLTDFGLAVTTCSPDQPLQHSCGSLPFCAPEVLGVETSRRRGYSGFAADVWSLAINFVELETGPFGIERLLGWSRPPQDKNVLIHELEGLEQLWVNYEGRLVGLKSIVSSMLVVVPHKRWTMDKVLGPEGLGSGAQHEVRPLPDEAAHKLKRSYKSDKVDTQGRHPSAESSSTKRQKSLIDSLGGTEAILSSITAMWDKFIWKPGFVEVVDSDPHRIVDLRAWSAKELIQLLDTGQTIALEESARFVHQGLDFTNAHFCSLVDLFGEALKENGAPESAVKQAVARLWGLRTCIIGDFLFRSASMLERNTLAWRASMLSSFRGVRGSVFVARLSEKFDRNVTLRNTSLKTYSAADIQAHMTHCISENVGVFGEVLFSSSNSDSLITDEEHLVLIHAAKDTMTGLGWPPEDIELLYHMMINEWEHTHFERELDRLVAVATEEGDLADVVTEAAAVMNGKPPTENLPYDRKALFSECISALGSALSLKTSTERSKFVLSAFSVGGQLDKERLERVALDAFRCGSPLAQQVSRVLLAAWALLP